MAEFILNDRVRHKFTLHTYVCDYWICYMMCSDKMSHAICSIVARSRSSSCSCGYSYVASCCPSSCKPCPQLPCTSKRNPIQYWYIHTCVRQEQDYFCASDIIILTLPIPFSASAPRAPLPSYHSVWLWLPAASGDSLPQASET